mmetsp:Transcript_105066/g.234437  ORF Transcript_105066/g.234437 Transcript_105066/m.234437 type:complete len:582 (-) Transcript_105066:784-2529(-)
MVHVPSLLLLSEMTLDHRMVLLSRSLFFGDPAVELLELRMRGCQLPGVLIGIVADNPLDVVQALRHRGMVRIPRSLVVRKAGVRLLEAVDGAAEAFASGEASMQLVQLGVRRLQLPGVRIRRITDSLLHVTQALGCRGVMAVAHLRIVRMLRVRGFEGLQLPHVLVRGVAEVALEVVHTLLEAGMMPVQGRLVLSESGVRLLKLAKHGAMLLARLHAPMQLLQLRMGGLQLLGMPVCRVAEAFLQVVDSLRYRSMVPIPCLGLLAELPMRSLHGLNLLGVFVQRFAEERLEVVDTLLHTGVVRVARLLLAGEEAPKVMVLRRMGVLQTAVQLVDLGVSGFQLLSVLIRRIAEGPLDVLDALLQLGMVCLPSLVLARELGMSGLGHLQLSGMLVGGLAQQRLEILEAFIDRGVVSLMCILVLGQLVFHSAVVGLAGSALLGETAVNLVDLGMRRLQVLRVLVGRVADVALKVLEAFLHGGVVCVGASTVTREARMCFLEVIDGSTVGLAVGEAPVHLLQLSMGGCYLLSVLVGRVPEQLLEVLEALPNRSMVRMLPLDTLQILGVPHVGILEILDCLRMLVR